SQDKLDIERPEHDAAAFIDAEREIFPVQITDAEPAPQRERTPQDDRKLAPDARVRASERLEREALHLAAKPAGAGAVRPGGTRLKEFERWEKAERLTPPAVELRSSIQQLSERAISRKQQPLPEQRARLLNPAAAHRNAPPEIV